MKYTWLDLLRLHVEDLEWGEAKSNAIKQAGAGGRNAHTSPFIKELK